ncbi:MAG: branched-chain alpha-keto acid dehydrogenase subunit E2 [Neptuniibacter caesariensis]|uniref:Branched-chain alpha-keto acid dehydrogenase subunit E2 n=1 Tax=Neptuniibacter caesariensis TaxID=207954 RepID=A0A2G6JAH3_NEPCE|nr:MAG: branched-chain alpha-keto acid dehydrogenase subunit E2 [Neptuniibacter caesariensis]
MASMIKIWDLPTRLFHWTLVALFAFLIISGKSDDMMQWHFYAGYLVSGLILFRIIWGVLGTRYARFSSFKLNPTAVITYTKNLLKKQHTSYYGHTPAGSVMVVILLGSLALQLITGMLSTDDILWSGPFYSAVSENTAAVAGKIHETVQNLLLILVILHILAIIFYKVKFKEPLVSAMIHGEKPLKDSAKEPAREGVCFFNLCIAALPAIVLTCWLFTLPI